MNAIETDQKKVKPKAPKIADLLNSSRSVILGTIDENGNPLSSYAPYVYTEGSFQILVSFMAKHTHNLKYRKRASVMLIEDESATKQIYARDRLTIECEATVIEPETECWNHTINTLRERHGKIVDVLWGLNDFILINLKPVRGSYVNGFGSAYSVNADLTINDHVRGAHGQHAEDNK